MSQRIIRALAAAIAASAAGMTLPQPAYAGAQPIRIAGTQGLGINLRTAPGSDGQVIGNIPEGGSPDYFCFKHGQSVNGVDLWFWVAWEGQKGYYSGFYDTIPPEYMNDAALWQQYGIGECEKPVPNAAKLPTPAPNAAPVAAEGRKKADPESYNRFEAINWALQHAQDGQPKWGGCTWFVSQALWAGGFPQVRGEWTDDDRYPAKKGFPKSLADSWQPRAAASKQALTLWNYLQENASVSVRELDFSVNEVPDARQGDIIAYDWGQGEGVSHLTMVTSIAPGQYPEVSEWGTTVNEEVTSRYRKRGWTWRANTNEWLQSHYPHIKAYLLHFER